MTYHTIAQCVLSEYPKYATMQRSSRTQNMPQKTEWVFVYFEKYCK